jgi:hypothetical protein
MGILTLIFFLIFLVVGIISMVSYSQSKGEMKTTQVNILENLKPERVLTANELEDMKRRYKLNLDSKTPVYSLTGGVGYIVLESNGAGRKEWLIADVLVAPKSATLLEKKSVRLEEAVMDEDKIKPKIDDINKRLEVEEITEDQAQKEAEQILEKYLNNTIEFVIANPLRKDKPVHLLNYKGRDMEKTVNLLA